MVWLILDDAWSATRPGHDVAMAIDEHSAGDLPESLPQGELAEFELSADGSEYVSSSGEPVKLKTPGPVPLSSRQGVFAHSFKCSVCDLEFALVSWQRARAGVGRTFCPECGEQTPMIHYLALASSSPQFTDGSDGPEVYQLLPLGGDAARLMDDSVFPALDRY